MLLACKNLMENGGGVGQSQEKVVKSVACFRRCAESLGAKSGVEGRGEEVRD